MNIVIINEQPAIGKLTVGRHLSEVTHYPLFHVHLTCDIAKALFEWGSPGYHDTNEVLRLGAFRVLLRHKVAGVVFTFCYSTNDYADFADNLKSFADSHSCRLLQVSLRCDPDEQRRRVCEPSRRRFTKINDVENLKLFENRKMFADIPGLPTLAVDNTHLLPTDVARLIAGHFGHVTPSGKSSHGVV